MIRLLVADDQQLFRTGLIRVFDDVPNVSIVGEAATGEDTVASARSLKPDIILMEILLGGMGGLEATQRIVRFEQAPRVIALTHCVNAPYPAQMLKAGARGYLSKNVNQAELLLAIRRVFGGQRYVCHDVAQELASYAYEMHVDSPFDALSNREMQIMTMVVNCQKVSDISIHLHLSPKTVNSYRYRIFEKLKISSDVELALLAVRHGMVPGCGVPKQAKQHPLSAEGIATHDTRRKAV
jgi:two-component system, NarL family, invasion response regulator UvrY